MKEFLARTTWTIDNAKKIVAEASPNYNAQKTEDAAKCLLLMHEMVVQLDLRPCLRTVYQRVAFQSSRSNALRFTLDKKVMLIKEYGKDIHDSSKWCFDDDMVIPASEVKCVPYAVMEVKLAGSDMPSVIEALEQDETFIRAEKFSKFLTGTASFHLDKVKKLPYWADHPAFVPLFSTASTSVKFDGPTSTTNKHSDNVSNKSFLGNGQSEPADVKYVHATAAGEKTNRKGLPFGLFGKSGSPSGHVIASKTRLRVEPKTFFANERTLIQWITGALLLMTVAALLIDIDDNSSTRLIGFFLIVCGAFVVCYGVFVYFRRIYLMTTGSAYGYVDYLGPILLACCVLGSIGVLSYFIFHTALPPPEFSQPYITAAPGLCEMYSFTDLSNLEFQPSDVVVDSERNILLIPSLSTIVSVPLFQRTISVPEVLIDIPGADLEALTAVGDRLFAVSEGDKDSRLFELQWDSGRLTTVQEYLIPSGKAEGIAFVPESRESPFIKLYVAGNNHDGTIGSIDLYRLPASSTSSGQNVSSEVVALNKRPLNANLLNQGLLDSKIASLNYFEDVLYILHDNARVVRAWNIQKGEMLAEWKLPRVGGDFLKQWEGMALERRLECPESSSVFLRGEACVSSLYLHLTLDTPPQVWSLKVEKDVSASTVIFPLCAAAFDVNKTTGVQS